MVAPPSPPAARARRATRLVARGLARAALGLALALAGVVFLPPLAGYERYVLTGASMEPTIPRGSVVFDEVVDVDELRRGDVVTLVPPGADKPLSHRIVSLGRGRDGRPVLRTKGDANAQADLRPFVLLGDRQARVSFSVPLVGHAFMWLATREGRLLALALPAALMALWLALGIWRDGEALAAAAAEPELAAS